MIKGTIIYFVKETLGAVLLIFGGIYFLKYFLKREEFLIVFNYHNFSKYNNYKIKRGNQLETGFNRNFEKQIKWLEAHFNFLSSENFFHGKPSKGINIMLTFDDGYKDNFDIAYPIIKKNKVPTAFFIVTSIPNANSWLWHDKLRFLVNEGKLNSAKSELILKDLNRGKEIDRNTIDMVNRMMGGYHKERHMMSWEEIITLGNNDFIIGSHTHTHTPLQFLTSIEKDNELTESLEMISSHINRKVTHFAYPNGLYDDESTKKMVKYGIKYAYTTKNGLNKKTDSPLHIKRIGINVSDSRGVVLLKIFINRNK